MTHQGYYRLSNMNHLKLFLAVLILGFLVSCCLLFEVPAKLETEGLMRSTLPPASSIVGGPYQFGQGNDENICQGRTTTYVIGSPLTEQQIEDYYTHQLSPGWSKHAGAASSITWVKEGNLFDMSVLVEYRPWYLGEMSEPGRKLKQAREQYTTAYHLTLMVDQCP